MAMLQQDQQSHQIQDHNEEFIAYDNFKSWVRKGIIWQILNWYIFCVYVQMIILQILDNSFKFDNLNK